MCICPVMVVWNDRNLAGVSGGGVGYYITDAGGNWWESFIELITECSQKY